MCVRSLGERLVVEHAGGLGGQVELRDLGGSAHDAAVPGGLAVLEDRAPREGGDLAHRDGLGEQDGRVGVVPRREVDQAQRDEQPVGVLGLQAGDELGPDRLDQERLDVPVGRAVLRVHREDDEVADAVDPLLLRLEGHERVEEVGHPEALRTPPLEVGHRRGEVRGVVGEQGGERGDRGDDVRHERGGCVVRRGIRNRAVLRL
jgi:hypothetical protein